MQTLKVNMCKYLQVLEEGPTHAYEEDTLSSTGSRTCKTTRGLAGHALQSPRHYTATA
jgi:hypothetical protein